MALHRPSSPPWSIQQPSKQWSIIEIKNGVEVAEHDLTTKKKLKDYPKSKMILFGRADDLVDIVLHHDSISRFHARIAFDEESETPWLRDLSSTHGVFVNKQRLPANTIGRDETMSTMAGTRGVIVYPDDVIQFGASSRYFCVVGPEEYSRSSIAIRKYTLTGLNESASITSKNNAEESASFHDDEYSDEPEFFLNDENIPENLRSEWEKIKALQYKMENIETESERIQNKGDAETLSTGQVNQLERNNERIATLKDQIHSKEAELHQKIFPNSNNNQHRKFDKATADPDEEEDTYFDRTCKDQKHFLELNEDGETIETLMVKWNDLQKKQTEIISKLMVLNEKEMRLEQDLLGSNADDDIFFIRNDLNLVRDNQQNLQQEKLILSKHLDDVEEMIHVANPKLRKSIDGFTWSDPRAVNVKLNSNTEQTDPIELPVKESTLPSAGSIVLSSDHSMEKSSHQPTMMAPPPKRMKTFNSSGIASTVAALTTTSNSLKQQPTQELQSTSEGNRPASEFNLEVATTVDQQDTWQVPKDQDGSGITKLNAKFAGRY